MNIRTSYNLRQSKHIVGITELLTHTPASETAEVPKLLPHHLGAWQHAMELSLMHNMFV